MVFANVIHRSITQIAPFIVPHALVKSIAQNAKNFPISI
jgi:hypothetical protein